MANTLTGKHYWQNIVKNDRAPAAENDAKIALSQKGNGKERTKTACAENVLEDHFVVMHL